MHLKHGCMVLISLLGLALSACMSWADLDRQREQTHQMAGEEMASNIEVANRLVEAIDQFEADEGRFPSELSALLPGDLAAIPKTLDGRDFQYTLDTAQGYYLCFEVLSVRNLACCYHHRLKVWDCSGGCE